MLMNIHYKVTLSLQVCTQQLRFSKEEMASIVWTHYIVMCINLYKQVVHLSYILHITTKLNNFFN